MASAHPLPLATTATGTTAPRARHGRYELAFACSDEDVDAALRLRFEVFNLELGEGLRRSRLTGRDRDPYDAFCRHLIVRDTSDGAVVGTYRVQTADDARRGHGFYTASEFDLSALPSHVLDGALELGRACIARPHRNTRVLYLLWRGIAALASDLGKRWLFGCCSLTSQDPREGRALLDVLAAREALHPAFDVRPRSGFQCWPALRPCEPAPEVEVPRLFDMYLSLGAKVCGEPAIDREFGTIDYLVLFDLGDLDARSRRRFLPSGSAPCS